LATSLLPSFVLKKTKSLEPSKQKRKASEGVSDAEIQAAWSLAQLGQEKGKEVVKKIVVATVQRVSSAFSDDQTNEEPRLTSFSSCLWYDLRFGVRHNYSPGSENEFVDVETFSEDVLKVQVAPVESAIDAEAGTSQTLAFKDKASPEFTKDLEMTVQRGDDPVENPSLIESREELPKGQDPSPSVISYNESFGTYFRGELLSVRGEVVDSYDDTPKFSLLWTSPEFVDETEEELPKKRSRLIGETPSVFKKHPSAADKQISSSLQKSLTIVVPTNEIPLRKLNPTG
jgi:hypothetical protein